jgi:hypothetical protein
MSEAASQIATRLISQSAAVPCYGNAEEVPLFAQALNREAGKKLFKFRLQRPPGLVIIRGQQPVIDGNLENVAIKAQLPAQQRLTFETIACL